MTAINIFRQRYRAAIITDTAGYDADGYLRAFVSKCFTLPHMKAAVATRGSTLATAIFGSAFGEHCRSFDDLVANGGAIAERVYDEVLYALAQSRETEIDILIAGWSDERNCAGSYMLSSRDVNGFEPWEFHEAPECVTAPVPSGEVLAAVGFDVTARPDKCDPVSCGLQLMEAQRLMTFPTTTAGEGSHHIIGGSVVYTEITRDGISQRILRTWPDEIGERITPEPVQAVAAPPAGMSRQQRRAMERAQRKGRVAA